MPNIFHCFATDHVALPEIVDVSATAVKGIVHSQIVNLAAESLTMLLRGARPAEEAKLVQLDRNTF